jgi:hypothetical protein
MGGRGPAGSLKRSWPRDSTAREFRPQGALAVAERLDPQRVFVPRASSAPRWLAPQLSKINVQQILAPKIDRSDIVTFILPS